MKIRRIKQEDDTGCGLACIAMLARTGYKEVGEEAIELEIQRNGEFWTGARELHILGRAFGFETGQRRAVYLANRSRNRKRSSCKGASAAGSFGGIDHPATTLAGFAPAHEAPRRNGGNSASMDAASGKRRARKGGYVNPPEHSRGGGHQHGAGTASARTSSQP